VQDALFNHTRSAAHLRSARPFGPWLVAIANRRNRRWAAAARGEPERARRQLDAEHETFAALKRTTMSGFDGAH